MHFGCYQCHYPQLQSQFDASNLNVFNNNWDNVHDFTPVQGETNWDLISRHVKIDQFLDLPCESPFASVGVSFEQEASVVPVTAGVNLAESLGQERCLLVLDASTDNDSVRSLVKSFLLQDLTLVRMKFAEVDSSNSSQLPSAEAVTWGQILSLDLCGVDAVAVTHRMSAGQRNCRYVSCDAGQGRRDVEAMFQPSDFNMS
jgi:protein XRP2